MIMKQQKTLIVAVIITFLMVAAASVAMSDDIANNHAVIIGIDGYGRSMGRLSYCVADAKAVARQLVRGGQFPAGNVVLMTDESDSENQPTYARLRRRFMRGLPDNADTLLVYFAGHGVIGDDGEGMLVPIDGGRDLGLPISQVRAWLRQAGAENTILILDACHSGQGTRGLQGIAPDMAAGPDVTVFASAMADQISHEDEDIGHGIFTAYLVQGLAGEADLNEDGVVTGSELFRYVSSSVTDWTRRRNFEQTPTVVPRAALLDVPVAVLPDPGEAFEVPDFTLPEIDVPAFDLTDMSGDALERFEMLRGLLVEKRAEIKEKSQWYSADSDVMQALREHENELQGRIEGVAQEAFEEMHQTMKALNRAMVQGRERGLLEGHPEMRDLASRREEYTETAEYVIPHLKSKWIARLTQEGEEALKSRDWDAAEKIVSDMQAKLKSFDQSPTLKEISNQLQIQMSRIRGLQITWVSINDPAFRGEMSRYPTTNAQYAQYLNEALASGDIEVDGNQVKGKTGTYRGQNYYRLDGPGWSRCGATNGGKSRISYNSGRFTVERGLEDHPVTYVSWYGAMAFAEYYGWRLPTEEEWEGVASYTDGRRYATGSSLRSGSRYLANYRDNDSHEYARYGTTPVGHFGTFGYGMADMAGNVWDWTSTVSGSARVLRGGSWSTHVSNCAVSNRRRGTPVSQRSNGGFRVCR